jgi:hypothetical protein
MSSTRAVISRPGKSRNCSRTNFEGVPAATMTGRRAALLAASASVADPTTIAGPTNYLTGPSTAAGPESAAGIPVVVGEQIAANPACAGALAPPSDVLQADHAGKLEAFAAASTVGQVAVAISDAKLLVHPKQQRKIGLATTLVEAGVAESGQQQRGATGLGGVSPGVSLAGVV